ncbi:hypothetical protein VE03_06432 [Pseudogymnoascus sp. 23342-1-I1]|nr:hypothetical protein VE03_06432 [Pseudogymnoascus sp. 23342-1-I1]
MDTTSDNKVTGNMILYDEVLTVLPEGVKAVSVEEYGDSLWSQTGRINAMDANSTQTSYFLKYVSDEHGEPQLEGEYTGMLELYNTAPQITPKPHPFLQLGNLASIFQLMTVRNLGQWDDSWTSCFARLLKGLWELDSKVNGHWDELDTAMENTLTKVIPRLIGILERDGRSIKPCLIHGDFWESNIGTDADTGNIYIFDASAYYAHNEMEIGIWTVDHHEMQDKVYRQAYAKQFRKRVPKEAIVRQGVPKGADARQGALNDLQDLIAKYGDEHADLSK